MTVYLVRHTKPAVESGVCYGQSDVPLADSYHTELAAIQKIISGKAITHCFSSPLTRCLQLAQDLHARPVVDERLKELNFGDWEMHRWDDLDRRQVQAWGDHFVTEPCPNGESFTDLQQRVLSFWNEHYQSNAKNILVITHGGPIRTLIATLLRQPLEQAFSIDVPYGSVFSINPLSDGWNITPVTTHQTNAV